MKGRICVITGATSGIGLSAAVSLAKLGAALVIVARNLTRGQTAVSKIKEESGSEAVDLVTADLSVQSEIRKAAKEIQDKYPAIHVLINNAGLALTTRTVTSDGIETTFAVNHLAYFLLTNLLLDQVKAGAPSRIIVVSSEAHRSARFDLDNLQSEKNYSGFGAYSISKMCNLLFAWELARRLEGTGVIVNALHPGYLNTGIWRDAPGFLQFLVKITAGTPEKGGNAIVNLATNPEFTHMTGKYFDVLKEAKPASISHDQELASKLWEISARLTKL